MECAGPKPACMMSREAIGARLAAPSLAGPRTELRRSQMRSQMRLNRGQYPGPETAIHIRGERTLRHITLARAALRAVRKSPLIRSWRLPKPGVGITASDIPAPAARIWPVGLDIRAGWTPPICWRTGHFSGLFLFKRVFIKRFDSGAKKTAVTGGRPTVARWETTKGGTQHNLATPRTYWEGPRVRE